MQIDKHIESSTPEELFDIVFKQDAIGVALRSVDPNNSRWLRVNQKFCDMLGYAREQLLQLTSVETSLPGDQKFALHYNRQLLRGDLSSYSGNIRYVRKDGAAIWTNTWLSALLGRDGKPTQIFSVIEDISERRQMEATPKAIERRFRTIADIAPAGIFHTNIDGDVTYVNEYWCQLAGMSSEAAKVDTKREEKEDDWPGH